MSHSHAHAPAPVHGRPAFPARHRGDSGNTPGVVYTCPMHPQIRASAPGNCPICGMTLEPVTPLAVEERNVELESMTRRFWVALALSIPLLVMTMGPMLTSYDVSAVIDRTGNWLALPHWMPATWSQCVQAVLATPVVLWAGWPFLERGAKSFRTRQLNMFSLIALGVSAAYFFSVFALFFPDALPHAFRRGHELPLYFEAACGHRDADTARAGAGVARPLAQRRARSRIC